MTLARTGLKVPLKYAPADWYYRIPERQIYRGYPVYMPSKEPPNYIAFLQAQDPEIAFDASKLTSESDWIRAGEAVFSAPTDFDTLTVDDIHDPGLWEKFKFTADAEGALPGWRYVIRKKGKVELVQTLCGGCHERVINGQTVAGAPGNAAFGAQPAFVMHRNLHRAMLRGQKSWDAEAREIVERQFSLFSVPWLTPDPADAIAKMTAPQITTAYESESPGVVARYGTNLLYAPKIPDLIGVQDRAYLGATGLHRNRGIEDLMRYAALEAGMDQYSQNQPDPSTLERLSDTQLYALALYLRSLRQARNPSLPEPPKKGKKAKAVIWPGQQVFEREGCPSCHPAPLYTNNKLIAAADIGTDPRLTLQTRKGTGFYVVPSLRGLWYREPLQHSGAAATLDSWFDPARLREIKGHEFGLKLSYEDRQALFDFLRSL